jgi:hypothetical protein
MKVYNMKIHLDFDNKVISIDKDILLGDLITTLSNMNIEWIVWKVNTTTIFNRFPNVIDDSSKWWKDIPITYIENDTEPFINGLFNSDCVTGSYLFIIK